MPFEILTTQLSVEVTTVVTFVLTLALAAVMTQRYLSKKARSLMFWCAAVWIFAVAVFLEILFAYGLNSEPLISAYLLLVAILVELLALGSMELIKSKRARELYGAFAVLSTILLIYSLSASRMGNMLTDYIVYGNLPLSVAITSSLITFPAAAIIVAIAAKSYLVRRSNKLLSIIAGVVIVSVAGTLYIVQFPALLYISEFIGILALWYGFI